MNQVTQEQKDSVTKTFAIVGFVAAILFAVWLAVQVVSVIPSAFSSLASIADGVYNYNEDQTLTIATKKSVINSGEVFTVSWTQMTRPGTYALSYKCTEGTSANVQTAQDTLIPLGCDVIFNLGDSTSVDISINSEKQRFTDVLYTIIYTPKNEASQTLEKNSLITIINTGILTYDETDIATNTTSNEIATDEVTAASTLEQPVTNIDLTAGKPTTIEKTIYAIPISNPNGKIDLEVIYLGVGTLSGKTFKRAATISTDEQGSFQFSVQNIGTKTSDKWTFDALLPSGIEYTSEAQVALKPNEKAIITIGFEGLSQIGIEKFGADVTVKHDTNKQNNNFTWVVEIVK